MRADELRALEARAREASKTLGAGPKWIEREEDLDLLLRVAEDLERAENLRSSAVDDIRQRMATVETRAGELKAQADKVPELELAKEVLERQVEELRETLGDRATEPSDLEAFYAHLLKRLRKGGERYGEESFERPNVELLEELELEVLDLAGWGYVLWHRLQTLVERERVRAENLEPLWRLETKGAELLAAGSKEVLLRARDYVVAVLMGAERQDMTGETFLERLDSFVAKLDRSLLERGGLGRPPAEPGARHADELEDARPAHRRHEPPSSKELRS